MQGITPELAERMPRLLQAMESIGGDVELHTMLDRIVTTAAELADAHYAALAVLNEDGSGIGEFVTHGTYGTYGTDDGEPAADKTAGRLPGREGLIRAMLESTDAAEAMLLDDIITDPRCADFPPGHPRTRSLIGVPVRVHGAGYGALYLADKAGGHTFTADDIQIMRILATEAGIAVGNARLYEAVRQQSRWMDGSLELATSLLSEDADHALAVVAEQARRLADAAVAAVLEPSGEGLEIVAVSADEPGGLLGTVLPVDAPPLDRVLAGEPVYVDDPAFISPELARRYGPAMALPLASDGRIVGALALARPRDAAPFSVPERALATQFAQHAALALVLTRARVDREQLAVLEDRDRIARDLHDLVIQRLFAVGMILEGAQRASLPQAPEGLGGAPNAAPGVADRIGSALRELDATVQEIRTAIFALQQHPDEVPSGLRTRALRETGAVAQTIGFRPSVSFSGPVDARVPAEVARNLLAALREALSNAARHADPTRLDVRIDATGDAVRLTVADDGVGLPEDADGIDESGLRNLRRRAEALGGSAALGPGIDGKGTTVTWQAPI
ncbi:GAF domain-containing sensor histidine kinase [Streptomyces sp. 6N223]|uniref:GAF domain-containing sensor histidine kinase n=1 Tax=Streptomyces sp. 6N223 TaxID=3457412 RepID=UPI003FD4ADA5